MGTAERTASDKSATLRGINPANTDSTECPNPATGSDGNRRKAVLHSDGYRTGCTRCSLPLYRARRQKIGQHNGAHFYTIGQRKGLGIGGRKESLFVLATDVEQNVIYVGEGDNHPGLYRRALRIAPGEPALDRPAPGIENGRKPSFRCPYPLPPAAARSGTLHPSGRGLPAFRRTSAWNHAGTVRSLVRWR